MPISGTDGINETEDGIIQIDFWHKAGEQSTASLTVVSNQQTTSGLWISSVCEECPDRIPTMGQ
jgi:hypothetical protein